MELYHYAAPQWILIFLLYCLLGWCFESTVVSVQQRHFVNRGFLHGPMLPIYGFGATLLLLIGLPLHDHPVWMFLCSMAAATVFEYAVGVLMETLFKVKYWDYSTHRFQFQGRICLQSSLCWGAMGLLLTDFIHPPIARVVTALPLWAAAAIAAVWLAAFAADVGVSVRTALDLAKMLRELDKLREEAGELRRQLSETALVGLTNLSYRVDEARGEWMEKLGDAADQLTDSVGDVKEQLLARLQDVRDRFDAQADGMKRRSKRLLRGNPDARSARYDDVLQRLKKSTRRR